MKWLEKCECHFKNMQERLLHMLRDRSTWLEMCVFCDIQMMIKIISRISNAHVPFICRHAKRFPFQRIQMISRVYFHSFKTTHLKMKPLQTSRQIFSWFCVDAIDGPLNQYQTMVRKIFPFIFGFVVTAIATAINLPLVLNHTSSNGIDDLFFGLYQLVATFFATSVIIATFISGPKLALLFRSLDNIYNTCKGEIEYSSKIQHLSIYKSTD